MRSPQRRGVRKDDVHEESRGEQSRSATQSVSEMGARGDGKDRNCTKPVMEVVGGDTRFVGEDWADSEIKGEIHRTGDVDKDNRDLCLCETAPPPPFFMSVGPNPREWVESCCCLSKWRFD